MCGCDVMVRSCIVGFDSPHTPALKQFSTAARRGRTRLERPAVGEWTEGLCAEDRPNRYGTPNAGAGVESGRCHPFSVSALCASARGTTSSQSIHVIGSPFEPGR